MERKHFLDFPWLFYQVGPPMVRKSSILNFKMLNISGLCKAEHSVCTIWYQRSLAFLLEIFSKGNLRRFSRNLSNSRVTQYASLIAVFYEKGYWPSSKFSKRQLWGGCQSLAIRTSGQLGYLTICPWSWRAENYKSAMLQCDVDLYYNYGESGFGWSPITPCSSQVWAGMT